ncbi:NAD(P)/FAD-dependent oxidoreductase [Isachenkonia alkalipeptolytica]|uniref:NAD(P)/FAD-dependent oxidoreductase n=1 Tax=Isachenkonia alkalipeptolytica TaxID=2565777 RepID=A0AA44BDL1_9CLOT|nr:NAD(P)/FAD-dependent oxidoreductase [Isachenkonia alkalipeptolytica]
MNPREVLIIGGGASGLTAAISAARKGARVTLIEGLNRVGKKILATGNGRCNLSNMTADKIHYHGENPEFMEYVVSQVTVEETLGFFQLLGLETKVEEGGKVFPLSDQASGVLDLLRYEVEKLGVRQILGDPVISLEKKAPEFTLKTASGKKILGDRVILATGGKSAPKLGSTGTGYALGKALGHSMTPVFPALVQIKCENPGFRNMKGVKIQGRIRSELKGRTLREEKGEILFTDYGVSGPPVLQLSRGIAESLGREERPGIVIDFFPEIPEEKLYETLWMMVSLDGEKPLDFSLIGLLNKKVIPVVLREIGVENLKKPCGEVGDQEIQKLTRLLKACRLKPSGTLSWKDSQVTAGGFRTKEIHPNTLESKTVPGLYFAGEVLDIDGDCGGFNLQWAWSSGIVAGERAAR